MQSDVKAVQQILFKNAEAIQIEIRQEEAEASSKDEAGQALDATAEMADVTIDNDGTLEELERKLGEVWSNLSRTQ